VKTIPGQREKPFAFPPEYLFTFSRNPECVDHWEHNASRWKPAFSFHLRKTMEAVNSDADFPPRRAAATPIAAPRTKNAVRSPALVLISP
jgi:hypothetical protein